MKKRKNAYSLTELSITLTIIALFLGMLMQAQKFIDGTQNKRTISEIEKITQAMHEFKIKHSFSPGDFPHTSSYYINLSSSYDGNGNGRLDDIITGSTSETDVIPAILQAAEYLPDFNYASDDTITSLANSKASWFFECHRSCSDGMYDYGYAKASLNLAIDNSWTPALAATNAYNIDAKIDDGEAKQGQIMGFDDSGNYSCALGSGYTSADDGYNYDTSQTGLDCVLQVNLEKTL